MKKKKKESIIFSTYDVKGAKLIALVEAGKLERVEEIVKKRSSASTVAGISDSCNASDIAAAKCTTHCKSYKDLKFYYTPETAEFVVISG